MLVMRTTSAMLALAFQAVVATQDASEAAHIQAWIEQLEDPADMPAAEEELIALGSPAVSFLIKELMVREADQRQQIILILDSMRGGAVAALPALKRLLAEEPLSDSTLQAIGSIAPHASNDLLEELQVAMINAVYRSATRDDRMNRSYVLLGRALQRTRFAATAEQPRLLELLDSGQLFEREIAAERLATVGDDGALEQLRHAIVSLHPLDISCRFSTGRIGGLGGAFSTIAESDKPVRLAAARAVVQLAGSKPEAAIAYCYLLDHGRPGEQRLAAGMLGRLSVNSRWVVDVLIRALDTKDTLTLREAVTSLGILAPPSAAGALTHLVIHPDKQVAARAAAALKRMPH
ncbi:MAG: HEAT repeat domain-containing protein [Planctomycetota bacterium]